MASAPPSYIPVATLDDATRSDFIVRVYQHLLAAIVGFEPVMRTTLITRTGEASYSTTQPWDTNAPRLAHFPEPSRFHF